MSRTRTLFKNCLSTAKRSLIPDNKDVDIIAERDQTNQVPITRRQRVCTRRHTLHYRQ